MPIIILARTKLNVCSIGKQNWNKNRKISSYYDLICFNLPNHAILVLLHRIEALKSKYRPKSKSTEYQSSEKKIER